MSRLRAALVSLAVLSLTAAGAHAAQLPDGLKRMATTAGRSTPCAGGGAAMGAAVGAGATAAAKAAGVKNAEAVGIVISALLTDKIACLLNPGEQVAAASATHDAVTQGIGSNVQWTSTSRPNVSGTSAVLSETKRADGALCRVVRDIVIVGGEETKVSKTLCRPMGSTGFTLTAAP